MAFRPFPLKGYSKFATVKSGANGTVKGELPLDDAAEAFVYAKELIINVGSASLMNPAAQLKGDWHIQILDGPEGAVLFEQTVTWTATVISIGDPLMMGIALVTWYPSPAAPGLPPGAGAFETTIIDGSPIEPGDAWKYTDFTAPTEFSEQGYTLFESEGVASVGGYSFQAVWVSPPYRCNVPDGAVLKIVADHWGIGQISKSATYSFSFKDASPFLDASTDQFGALLHSYSIGSDAGAGIGFAPFTEIGFRGVIMDSRAASINVDKFGRVVMLARESDGWYLHRSSDGGRNYEKLPGQIWPKEVRMARAILDGETVLTSASIGYDALFKRISPSSEISTAAGRLPKKQDVTPVIRGGVIYLIGDAGLLFSSRDNGATWKKEYVDPVPDDGTIVIAN